MSDQNKEAFVPVLTIYAEYGNAPFAWVVDKDGQMGLGPCLYDGCDYVENGPMSEGLWRKFADWAIEFDRTSFYLEDYVNPQWDWASFHARGLQLSRWLKEEVGDAYRVFYMKPCEDPGHQIEERTEVLIDGALLVSPTLGDLRDAKIKREQHLL